MRPLIEKHIEVVLLLWIQLAVYPCSFAKSSQNMNILCPANFKPLKVESSSNCSFKLSNDSNNFEYALRNEISWEDGTIQRIITDIITTKNDTRRDSDQAILPNKWLLAYIDQNGPFNFVSWSSDFKVLSLGLLSDDNTEPITVKINETTGNCNVEIGGNYMITKIVKLFTKFIREKVDLDKHYDYENIHLCYLSKFTWFEDSPWFATKQLFGIPFQEFGYKCCMVREDTVCCDDKLHRVEGYRLLPYIISICLLSYSPILLMRFAIFAKKDDDNKSQKEDNKQSKEVPVCLRFPFFLRIDDYKYFHNKNNKTHIKSIGDSQSTSKQGNIQNIPEQGHNQSIREPAHTEDSPIIPPIEKGNDKIVDCSLSVYNWFLKRLKRITFLLFFPSMIYFEFILLKSDVEWNDLLQTIGKDKLLFGFPTMLGSVKNLKFLPPEGPMGALIMYYVFGFFIIVYPSDFENLVLGEGICVFGKKTVHTKSSYNKIKKILLKYMYLPLNIGYGRSCTSFIKCKVLRLLLRLLLIILFPIYAFPIIPFSIIALVGWMKYWCPYQGPDQNRRCNCSRILKILRCIFFTLIFLSFYGIFVVMLSYSIYLLFYILFFTSLGFIMSPNKKSKILTFFVGAIVFEYQIIRDSVHFYTELFHLIVEICECDNSLKKKYITYNENGQCIEEYLVVEVFRKIRPAFVQTGHIIIKTVIVILIYASALTFMLQFNDKITDVIERVSILITSVTPIILQWRFKTVCPKKQRVEHIIRECVKEAEQKAKEAKLEDKKAEQSAQEGNDEKNHKEADRKAEEAEISAIEAELIAKVAELYTNDAKETEIYAREAERCAREVEREAKKAARRIREVKIQSKEAELKTKEDDMKTRESELKTKEDEIKTRESELKTKEDEIKTRESELKNKEDEINTKERELKTKVPKCEGKIPKADGNVEKSERSALMNKQTDIPYFQSMP